MFIDKGVNKEDVVCVCVCIYIYIYIWMMEYWAMLCWVAQSCPTLFKSMDCTPPGSSVHGNSLGQNTRVGCHALLQGNLPNSGIEPRSPALQADSLPSEPPGKPKHTGVGSLSLLQGIFSTQESKRGLPHWGWILYQMSYLGSPNGTLLSHKKKKKEWNNAICHNMDGPRVRKACQTKTNIKWCHLHAHSKNDTNELTYKT